MHDEFLCHVTAYGVCGGRRVGVPLGTYRAPTLPLALWWLRDRATWIAERLDPSPGRDCFPVRALFELPADAPDVPGALRAWRDGGPQQDKAAEVLAGGGLMRFAINDDTTEYELLAESVDALRMQRAIPSLAPAGAESVPEHRSPLSVHTQARGRGDFGNPHLAGLPSGAVLLATLDSSTVVFSSAAG